MILKKYFRTQKVGRPGLYYAEPEAREQCSSGLVYVFGAYK